MQFFVKTSKEDINLKIFTINLSVKLQDNYVLICDLLFPVRDPKCFKFYLVSIMNKLIKVNHYYAFINKNRLIQVLY